MGDSSGDSKRTAPEGCHRRGGRPANLQEKYFKAIPTTIENFVLEQLTLLLQLFRYKVVELSVSVSIREGSSGYLPGCVLLGFT